MRSSPSSPIRSRTRGLVLALAVLSVAVLGHAVPASANQAAPCQETTITLQAQADAWLDEDGPFSNKGSDGILTVRSAVPNKNARALVRFPLPDAVPPGCVIEFARLRLFAPSGDASSRLEAARLAFGWSENLVTWGTQPDTIGSPATAWGGDGYVQWNVKSQVQDILESANHGFVIRDAAESSEAGGEQAFHSREKGESPPELVIRYAAPTTEEPGPPAPPTPTAVTCGQELTKSVLLTGDLTNCPGDGLVIGKDRIIIDLGGHAIDGVGLGSGVRNDGYDSVTVRNGTIRDFDYGVQLLPETELNLIERLSLHDNQLVAVELSDAGGPLAGNEIRANLIERNGDGIALLKGTTATLVAGNTMTLNSGPGLLVAQSDANRLEDNAVSGSGDLGVGLEGASGNVLLRNTVSSNSDGGMEIVAGSNDNRVEDNTVSDSGDTGILVAESEGNEVIGNLSERMSDSGITLDVANDGVVRDNSVRFNPGGIQLDGSSRNLIESNNASETLGIGIELGGGSLANHVVRNDASANGAQGIYVSDEAPAREGNLLERNVASGNGSDGIVTAKGGHTLSFNVTHDNHGWGIQAAPGTIDGRGNVALRNTNSAQCFGIVCNADVTPPETSLGSGPADPTNSSTASFSFTGTDDRTPAAAMRFQCRLDGGAFTACTSPRVHSGLAEGEHLFEVRAVDQAGNADPSPASRSWVVDRTAPETSIGTGPADPSGERSASLEFSSSEPGSSFECRLDDEGVFGPCSSPASYTDLSEGAHRFEVRAVDRAGNVDASPASYAWTVDTVAPETSIDAGPADPTSERSASFEFSASEPGSRFECRLDEGDFVGCESPRLYIELGEGQHRFEVRAVDVAGNVDPSPASHSWTVDTVAPETSIGSGPADPTSERSASLEFSSSEPGSSFECRLNQGGFAGCQSPQLLSALDQGDHRFEVRAIDRAGNVDASPASHSWTVDTTAPETAIESGPAEQSGSRAASFAFAGEDDRSAASALRFECRVDAEAAFGTCSSPASYSDLAEGSHRFEVRGIDRAGNVDPSPASYSWTVDTVAPETSLGERPADPSGEGSARFEFTSSEAGSRFECRLDEAGFAACETGEFYSDLAEGGHRFEVRAIDRAGNVDASPASHAWTVDTVAPETSIDTGPAEQSGSRAASLVFAGEDDRTAASGLRFECRLDTGAFADCSSPASYADLTDGEHRFEVRAIDRAGNVDGAPASHAWTVDTVAPETSIDTGPAEQSGSRAASLVFAGEDDRTAASGLRFECRLDEGDFVGCSSPASYADLADGEHRFEVRAIDRAGNLDASPASYSWTVDTVAPATSIGSGPADPTSDRSASFEFTASEPGSRFECRLDTGAFADCSSPASYSDLAEGVHSFEVRAIDRAGNVDPSPATYVWTVDTTAPETSLGERPPDPSGEGSARFEFTSSEPGSRFECRLDEAGFAGCETGEFYSDLADGGHRFEVRAIDRAGNVDGAPASHVWTVDTVAPETAIDSGPADQSGSRAASFSFAGEDGGTAASALRFECRLDTGAFASCSSPASYSDLAEGVHRFEVRAIDRAGNVDPSPASYSWTVDTVAPETSIESGPADESGSRAASFSFAGEDGGTAASALRFECRLDTGAFASCSSPASYSDLAEGVHRFEVRAIDRAGNVDPSPASYSWTVDTVAPETSIESGPADQSGSRAASFAFAGEDGGTAASALRFECRLDTGAFAICSSPASYSDLAEGEHRFEVRAIDRAGNVDESPASHVWTVDTVAPETSLGERPPDPSGESSARFEFAADEPGSRFECRLDTGVFAACETGEFYSDLADGEHRFEVRAIDRAGNVDASPATYVWTVDTSDPEPPADTAPPETTLGDRPADPSTSGTASFSFSGADDRTPPAALRFECRLDDALFGFTDCSSPKLYSSLADGSHTFEVRAVDLAGNVDDSPATHIWTVDTTAPQTTIGSGPAATTSSTSATLTFSSSEADSTFECSLDGAAFAACASPREYAGLAGGSHQFRVRARDAAGNVDGSPAGHSWTIDATAPQTTIGSGPLATTSSTSATLTFSSSEPGSTFECRLDEGTFSPCSSPNAYSGLSTGSHTFQVRAVDPVGNVDATPAGHTWTIDTSPPGCTAAAVTTASVADSWVLQSSAGNNYGRDSVVKVDTKSGANARVLVRLTLPPIPPGCQVTDAKLRLYASSYKTGRTLEALRIAASWTETSVRWNNQPSTTGAAATAPSGSGYVQWTVTQQVQAMYSGGNNGFLIRDGVENGVGIEQGFNSREKGSSNPPQLVVTFGGL